MMKLYQSAGKPLLNIDLSELTMNVLWDSLNALQSRFALWTFSCVQDSTISSVITKVLAFTLFVTIYYLFCQDEHVLVAACNCIRLACITCYLLSLQMNFHSVYNPPTHNHFTALRTLYETTQVSWYLVPEGTFYHLLDFLVQNDDNTCRHTNNPDGLPPFQTN